MTLQPLFQNTLILRRSRVAIFADIIKIVNIFIKTIFKDSKKVKRIRNYLPKCNLYLYFLIQQHLPISGEKMLLLAKIMACVTCSIYSLHLLQVRYNCANFHYCRICVTDFREGGLSAPSPYLSNLENAHPEQG